MLNFNANTTTKSNQTTQNFFQFPDKNKK